MPNNYIAGFDPVAMGLVPIYGKAGLDQSTGTGENADWVQGEQTAWGKQLDDTHYVNYDLTGKETERGTNSVGTIGKEFLRNAAMMVGGGMALNSLVGAGALGSSAATGVAAGTEAFIPAANAFTFESLGGAMAVPEIAGVTAAEMGTAATLGGTSTLGTLTGAGYTAPAGSLTSGMTAGGAMATEASLTSAAGASSAFTGTLGSASPSLWSTIYSAVKDPVSYISKVLGVEDVGLVKDLKEVLGIGGAVAGGSTLFDYLMKGLQGGMNNSAAVDIQNSRNQNALDVANIGATSALDQIKLKDQQTQDANKRYSASVSGINYGGLINSTPKPLTRNDGSRVFSGNGLINRG